VNLKIKKYYRKSLSTTDYYIKLIDNNLNHTEMIINRVKNRNKLRYYINLILFWSFILLIVSLLFFCYKYNYNNNYYKKSEINKVTTCETFFKE